DGNGSHASTLKSPSYTKSVSWQHYPDTVSDAIEDTPQYRLKLVNGPDADSDNGKNSENTEDITESVKAPGADIATEVMTPTY
ncbi:hypothetical protein MZD51_23490, partial [Escherichia coli]|nr:hypothetical protein [Escherichia coli]